MLGVRPQRSFIDVEKEGRERVGVTDVDAKDRGMQKHRIRVVTPLMGVAERRRRNLQVQTYCMQQMF